MSVASPARTVTFADIIAAERRIKPHIYRSPTHPSLALSRLTGSSIVCKLDHLQITGSFKERGAANRLEKLSAAERAAGVIAASAGNHALALAYHGGRLNIPVTVVMPQGAPLVKVSNCRGFGAEVIQHGDSFDDARQRANQLAAESGKIYVHGFDDADVIAGAGTVGLELFEDVPDLDAVLVPIGGGGLIAGVALAIKSQNPAVRVIGVESAAAPTFLRSREAGRVVRTASRPTIADGLAISEVGQLCFDVGNPLIDDIVLVDEQSLSTAVLRLLELEKTVLEGAGAAALAGLLQHDLKLQGKKVGLVLCGGNIDLTAISRVIERGLVADGRLCRIRCVISDRPGGLATLTRLIADAGASVKEVFHDRGFAPHDLAAVSVTVVLETRDREHIESVRQALRAAGVTLADEMQPPMNADGRR